MTYTMAVLMNMSMLMGVIGTVGLICSVVATIFYVMAVIFGEVDRVSPLKRLLIIIMISCAALLFFSCLIPTESQYEAIQLNKQETYHTEGR